MEKGKEKENGEGERGKRKGKKKGKENEKGKEKGKGKGKGKWKEDSFKNVGCTDTRILYSVQCYALQWTDNKLVKCYSSSQETHLKTTEHHAPYGITQCYLPP